jgi:hypothetical protein
MSKCLKRQGKFSVPEGFVPVSTGGNDDAFVAGGPCFCLKSGSCLPRDPQVSPQVSSCSMAYRVATERFGTPSLERTLLT